MRTINLRHLIEMTALLLLVALTACARVPGDGAAAGGAATTPLTFSQMFAAAKAVVPAISPAEAQRRLKADPNLLLVDVRDSGDAAKQGRIPGAINVAYGNLLVAADREVPETLRDARLQDRARPIITQCAGGPVGAIAAKTLHDMGFTNVSYLDGGFEAWKAAGLPTEVASAR